MKETDPNFKQLVTSLTAPRVDAFAKLITQVEALQKQIESKELTDCTINPEYSQVLDQYSIIRNDTAVTNEWDGFSIPELTRLRSKLESLK